MPQQLINLNPDLKQLWDEGYDLEICGGYLLIHNIPFVNPRKEMQRGTLITSLTLISPTRIGEPQDHTIFFRGETPCDESGRPLIAIINNSNTQQLTKDITANHYFSSKPLTGKYKGYYDKVRTYAEILTAQAKGIDKSATAKIKRNE